MDIVDHFGLKQPLFHAEGGRSLFASRSFVKARNALIVAAHSCETPVVLNGPPGSGKTVLLSDVAAQLGRQGVRASAYISPAFVPADTDAMPPVMLIDEANSIPGERLDAIVRASRQRGATAVFASIDAARLGGARVVRLSPMSGAEVQDMLLEAAAQSGRPGLFSPAAQDAIVAASFGIPRIAKLLANTAALEAMFEGGSVIEKRHVDAAIQLKAPLPPAEFDYSFERPASVEPLAAAAAPGTAAARRAPDLPMSVAPEDADAVGYQPAAAGFWRRLLKFGSRGAIAATLLLGGLAAVVGSNALDKSGRAARPSAIAAMPQPADPGVLETEQALRLQSQEAAVIAPEAAASAIDPAAIAKPAAPAAASLPVASSEGAEVDAPPLPTPDTPGYRPPAPPMPSIAAAQRAGIPTTVDGVERTASPAVTAGDAEPSPSIVGAPPAVELPQLPGFND